MMNCGKSKATVENEEEEEVEGEDEYEEEEDEPQPKPAQPQERNEERRTDECLEDDKEMDYRDDSLLKQTQGFEKNQESTSLKQQASSSTSATFGASGAGKAGASALLEENAKKTSIWIRGMAPTTKVSTVKQLTSQYGKVTSAKIFNSRPAADGVVKNCFALITFADNATMELAISSLEKKFYQGRTLRVEKVTESHLTGSAERIAQEKRRAEQLLQKNEKTVAETSEKDRVAITEKTPMTSQSSKMERRSAQSTTLSDMKKADENPVNGSQVQEPAQSRIQGTSGPETFQKRKPIVYERSPPRNRSRSERRSPERDSRQVRSADKSNGANRRRGEESCRKHVVEPTAPLIITTTELRRNAQKQHQHMRASYLPMEDRGDRRTLPKSRYSPIRNRHQLQHDRNGGIVNARDVRDDRRHRQGNQQRHGQPQPPRKRQHYDEQEAKAQEMLNLLNKPEEERLLHEERYLLEREKDKIAFEAQLLERTRLEVELARKKLDLEKEARAMGMSAGRVDAVKKGRPTSHKTGSRRRKVEDWLQPPQKNPREQVPTSYGIPEEGYYRGLSSTTIYSEPGAFSIGFASYGYNSNATHHHDYQYTNFTSSGTPSTSSGAAEQQYGWNHPSSHRHRRYYP